MKKIFITMGIVLSLIFIFIAVYSNKKNTALLKGELNQKNSIIEGLEKEIEEKSKRYDEMVISYESKLTDNNNLDIDREGLASIGGIRLKYRMEQVSEILGKDYTVSEWSNYTETEKLWTYKDGIKIFFISDRVSRIELVSPKYGTDFNIRVGDGAKESIDKCKKIYKEFVSIHSSNGEPNLGWFESMNQEVIILHFNKNGDRFNDGIDVNNKKVKVEKIELSIYDFD